MNILIVEDDDYKYKNMFKDLKVIVEDLNIFRLNNCMDALMYFRTLKNNSDQKMKSILNLIAKYNYPTIIIQNMLDSVRPSVDGKKTEIEVAEEHKNRVKKIIQSSDIEDKNSVKIVQVENVNHSIFCNDRYYDIKLIIIKFLKEEKNNVKEKYFI